MATLDTRYVCLYSQQSADNVLGSNNPALQELETFGFRAALKSAINTNGFEQLQTESPLGKERPLVGTNRKIDIRYRLKQCGSVTDGEIDVCTPATAEDDLYGVLPVYVNEYKHRKMTINRDVYRSLCENPNDVIGMRLNELAMDIIREENILLIQKYIADLDAYFDTTSSVIGGGEEKLIKLFGDNAQPQAMALFKLVQEYKRKGYTARPIVVGSTSMDAWMYAQPIFRGDTEGRDIMRLPQGMPTFVDYQIDTQAGDGNEHAFSWIPGHAQLLEWFKYPQGSQYEIQREEGVKTQINLLNETFDYTVHDSFCDDNVTIAIGRGFDLWCANTELFNDPANGCGGQETKLNWLVDCVNLDCTDLKC